ncbi:MAG: uroporphyrinogen-III synthase, partial [Nitrosopumilus sp.]|nr:uroporphyrinogen-III synthase [Nitrosopumilus sp.]NNL36840.1 uroporphyrinogen-III synthase [Nitrosopumilus sp.]
MLDGKTIAITRSKDDAVGFTRLVKQNGGTAIPLPTIELVSKGEKIVDEFLESVEQYNPDYSVFMSSKAVKLLFDTAKKVGKLENLQLAVANTIVMSVGPKTTEALEAEGIKVNHQPTTFSSVGVGEEFTKIHAVGKKVIVPRSGASTPFLKELLNKIGIDVLEIHLYDVCAFRDTTQWNGFRELFSQNK